MHGASKPKYRLYLTAYLAAVLVLYAAVFRLEWGAIKIGFPDFSIFYTAARIVASGQGSQLYSDHLQESVQRSFSPAVAVRGSMLPYYHPPFEALLFLPLQYLPYLGAYAVWFAINAAAVVAACLVMRRNLPLLAAWPRWLCVLAGFAYLPVFIALVQGQDSILVLLSYTLAFAAMRHDRDFAAGAWLGLGLVKYHLILPFVLVLVLARRGKCLAGILTVAAVLAVLSWMAVGWRGLLSYPGYVWHSEHSQKYAWNALQGARSDLSLVTNLKGLLFSTLHGTDLAVIRVLLVILSFAVLTLAYRGWKQGARRGPRGLQLAFAALVIATVLVSYHTFTQDLSLILLAMALTLDGHPRPTLLLCIAVLFCGPLYLVLITRVGNLQLITMTLLVMFATILVRLRSLAFSETG